MWLHIFLLVFLRVRIWSKWKYAGKLTYVFGRLSRILRRWNLAQRYKPNSTQLQNYCITFVSVLSG